MPDTKITASALRADVYRILDRVAETGEPIEVERRGVTLRIAAVKGDSREERLRKVRKPKLWTGDPQDIFHIDWLEDWRKKWGIEK